MQAAREGGAAAAAAAGNPVLTDTMRMLQEATAWTAAAAATRTASVATTHAAAREPSPAPTDDEINGYQACRGGGGGVLPGQDSSIHTPMLALPSPDGVAPRPVFVSRLRHLGIQCRLLLTPRDTVPPLAYTHPGHAALATSQSHYLSITGTPPT